MIQNDLFVMNNHFFCFSTSNSIPISASNSLCSSSATLCWIKYYVEGLWIDLNYLYQKIRPSVAVLLWSGLNGRTFVHLSTRPPQSSFTVHLRPSRTNNLGPASEFVHEMDGLGSDSDPEFWFVVHMDGWTVRKRLSLSVEVWLW